MLFQPGVGAFFEFFADEDAGVVDEGGEAAEAVFGGLDGFAPALFVGDVEGDGQGLAAGVVDFVCDGLGLLVEDVAEDDAGAVFGEEAGFGGAHAAGGAGYEGYFVLESHLFSFG